MTHMHEGAVELGKTVGRPSFKLRLPLQKYEAFSIMFFTSLWALNPYLMNRETVRIFKPHRKWYSFKYYKSVNKKV